MQYTDWLGQQVRVGDVVLLARSGARYRQLAIGRIVSIEVRPATRYGGIGERTVVTWKGDKSESSRVINHENTVRLSPTQTPSDVMERLGV